jgi:hypothetical protein
LLSLASLLLLESLPSWFPDSACFTAVDGVPFVAFVALLLASLLILESQLLLALLLLLISSPCNRLSLLLLPTSFYLC